MLCRHRQDTETRQIHTAHAIHTAELHITAAKCIQVQARHMICRILWGCKKTENVQKKKTAEVQKKRNRLVLTRDVRQVITAVSVLFLLCIGVLCRYATILSGNRQIKDLEKQYNTIISSNQAMQTKIDKQLEMGEIEKYAREELGMMKAESYQKVYIDMNMPDEGTAVKSGSRAQNAVSGVPGTLMNAFRVLK